MEKQVKRWMVERLEEFALRTDPGIDREAMEEAVITEFGQRAEFGEDNIELFGWIEDVERIQRAHGYASGTYEWDETQWGETE